MKLPTLPPSRKNKDKIKLVTATPSDDADGTPIVLVSLGNSDKHVRMLPEDFEKLQARGLDHGWYLNGDGQGRHYVCLTTNKGENRTVARTLLEINVFGCVVRVTYADKDTLNLRRDNLIVVEKALPPTKESNQE